MLTTHPDLTLVLAQRASRLHTPRAVAMKVLELTQHPHVDAKQLTAEIESDPALTARILRVVNSAMFATRGEICDLEQAVAMLGVKTLRVLVMGFALPDSLIKSEHSLALSGYWKYVFLKSAAAKTISESIWNLPGEQIFATALLHDIGVLVLLQELGKDYAQLVGEAFSRGADLSNMELGLLGFEHAELGAKLLKHWGIPHALILEVEAPFKSDRIVKLADPLRDRAKIIHLADLLTRFLIRKDAATLQELMDAAKRYKNLRTPQLEAVIREVQKAEPIMANAYGKTIVTEDYLAALREAHRELADAQQSSAQLYEVSGMPGFERLGQLAEQLAQRIQSETISPMAEPFEAGTSSNAISTTEIADLAVQPTLDMPATMDKIGEWLVRSRRSRTPISLLLFELQIDLKDADSNRELEAVIQRLIANRFEQVPAKQALSSGLHFVARIERMAAVDIARDILKSVERLTLSDAITLNIGIASIDLVPPNFPAHECWEAAERCLNAARRAGGSVLKSIDVV